MSAGEKQALLGNTIQEPSRRECWYQPLAVNKKKIPLGAWLLTYFPVINHFPRISFRVMVLFLTFLCYTCYHLSRKPFSVVKIVFAPNCTHHSNSDNDTFLLNTNTSPTSAPGWKPFNGDHCNTILGSVDYSWLFTYAVAMFFSGMIADRMDLRYFLTIGMIGSGIATGLLGVAYYAHIHHLYYFIIVQILGGMMQSTGWPGVVAVMGNWFGKQGRGFLMGIWNSHTSVGNILGTIIPAVWAQEGKNWSWSFLVPGFIMIGAGIIMFLFLVVDPNYVGLAPPTHHLDSNTTPNSQSSVPTSPTSSKPHYDGLASEDTKTATILMSSDEEENIKESKKATRKSSVASITSYIKTTSPMRIITGNKEEGAIGFVGAIKIPGVLEFAFALFFSKLVAYTFLFWLPYYVENTPIGGKKLSDKNADLLSTLFDVGGIIGGILTGGLSDLINARAITCTLMLYLSVPALFMYRYFGSINITYSIVLMIFCGLFVNGPYACITTAVSSDLGTHKSLHGNQKAKATVSAIIDGTGSLGAALGPLLAGWISDDFGWNSVFYLLMISCFLSSLLLTRLVINEVRTLFKKLSDKFTTKELE